MKILVVGPSDTKTHGGMATVISDIRKSSLLNTQYDIDIFSSYIDTNLIGRILYSIFAYLKFLTIYKKYDLFHIHTASYGSTFRKSFYLRTIKKAGKKAILHIHSGEYLVFYNSLSAANQKKVSDFLHSADMVLTLSNDWKEKFNAAFHLQNCKVLPNGINIYEYAGAICNVGDHRNEFLFIGTLCPKKGIYDLINAVSNAVVQNPSIKVYVAGTGETTNIQKQIIEKGLENHVLLTGWLNMSQKIEVLKKTATLVLPSYYEGLPMCILEAMASGKAIISTTVGAIPEIISPDNGILITPGDVSALAAAMITCSSDIKQLRKMSESNIQRAYNEFSTDVTHKKLLTYYGSFLR